LNVFWSNKMLENFSSKALEVNLANTRSDDIEISEEQLWFIDLSKSKWGIHKRAEEFIIELNHKFVNYQYVIEALHNISLNDLWFYNSHDENEKALRVLVNIFRDLIDTDLIEDQRELLIKTLIKFMERLVNLEEFPKQIIWQCFDIIKSDMQIHELPYIFNSGYFKSYFNKIAQFSEYQKCLIEMTTELLGKCINYWESTSNIEECLIERNLLFDTLDGDTLKEIGKPFFCKLRKELELATNWDQLYSLMFFNDISNYFRSFTDKLETYLEKIYYLHYLLHLPGMAPLKDHLLYDMNRYLRNVLKELDENDVTIFLDTTIVLFEELKTDHAGTVLDCILTLGKEIINTKNESKISYFVKCLIKLGFNYPGEII